MISGKISAGEAFVMVSCETEKLEQGLRDVHQKLERETAHIAAVNSQLELEFKVDFKPAADAGTKFFGTTSGGGSGGGDGD